MRDKNCEHGGLFVMPVCEHIRSFAEAGVRPNGIASVWTDFGDGEIYHGFVVCDECARNKGIDLGPLAVEPSLLDHIAGTDITGMCLACFNEFADKVGIKYDDLMPVEFR